MTLGERGLGAFVVVLVSAALIFYFGLGWSVFGIVTVASVLSYLFGTVIAAFIADRQNADAMMRTQRRHVEEIQVLEDENLELINRNDELSRTVQRFKNEVIQKRKQRDRTVKDNKTLLSIREKYSDK